MKQGIVAPIPTGYEMSRGVAAVEAIKKLDPGQQITVLRNTVDMGFEPAVAASTAQRCTNVHAHRASPTTQITVEGITETTVSYFKAMNADDLRLLWLYLLPTALQPPSRSRLLVEAIASYMRAEAQGLNIMPKQASEALPDG